MLGVVTGRYLAWKDTFCGAALTALACEGCNGKLQPACCLQLSNIVNSINSTELPHDLEVVIFAFMRITSSPHGIPVQRMLS